MLKMLLGWLFLFVHYVVDDKGGGAGAAGAGDAGAGAAAAGSGAAAAGAGGGEGAAAGAGVAAGAGDGKGAAAGGAAAGDGKGAAGAGAGAGDGKAAGDGKPAWPDTWREIYAKGDAKKAERLGRYASPEAAIDALFSVQNRIGAGELRSVLPKDADEAALKAWRSENWIPESADKYELKLREGLVIGEADKPYVQAFLAKGHTKNMTADQASAVVESYYDILTQQAEQQADSDKKAATDAIAALGAEWGTEYKGNMNLVHGLLEAAPPGVKDVILAGRGPDGRPLMANADFIRTLNAWAREINPVSTVVPNAGANIGTAIDDELKGIEAKMRDRSSEYWKGPMVEKNGRKDTEMAHRYGELLAAKERLGAKKAA